LPEEWRIVADAWKLSQEAVAKRGRLRVASGRKVLRRERKLGLRFVALTRALLPLLDWPEEKLRETEQSLLQVEAWARTAGALGAALDGAIDKLDGSPDDSTMLEVSFSAAVVVPAAASGQR
jgi:hypothetical protein